MSPSTSSDEIAGNLNRLRHSLAHILAQAVLQMRPRAKLGIGPAVDEGFFHDFDISDEKPLSGDDLPEIEERMNQILQTDQRFDRREASVDEAARILEARGEIYKLEICRRLKEQGELVVTFYRNGDFDDLCSGPHVESARQISPGQFQLDRITSSHWMGDEDRQELTRIYGLAFLSSAELGGYLERRRRIQASDYRVLGKALKLFDIDDAVGEGLVLWKPRGSVIRDELERLLQEEWTRRGYSRVHTPHIGGLELYRESGHYPRYNRQLFPPIVPRHSLRKLIAESCSCADMVARLESTAPGPPALDGYLLRLTMGPHHAKIYSSRPRSYRELPVRVAELGTVYRSHLGELDGLDRLFESTQDAAHVFCTKRQLPTEIMGCLNVFKTIFTTLGITNYHAHVGLRDPNPSKYVGHPKNWGDVEQAYLVALADLGIPLTEAIGEASWNGPQILFFVNDALDREWVVGGVQLDYDLPERLGLKYIGAGNCPHRPVMVSFSVFGSMEHFLALLIEHLGGVFPTWLSPLQARILPIENGVLDYALEILDRLKQGGFRADLDDRSELLDHRVHNAITERVPHVLFIGPREQQDGTVTWRRYVHEKQLVLPVSRFLAILDHLVQERILDNDPDIPLPPELTTHPVTIKDCEGLQE